MKRGPNVNKLIIHKASLLMIPPSTPKGQGFATGVAALTGGHLGDFFKEASEWVDLAILAVRQAAEPNPWKTADDESIAAEILQGIEKVKSERKRGAL